jgi:hypothetical protein
MHRRATAAGARFVVLLIPTKESVFRPVVREPAGAYARLVDSEERMWKAARDFFDRSGIAYIDALPPLQARLREGVQPYPVSHDGHPNADGHAAIAAAVADWAGREGQTPR